MDRRDELELLRRSLAMLRTGAAALDREQAMTLLVELQEAEGRLRRLRDGLVRLLDEDRQHRPGADRLA